MIASTREQKRKTVLEGKMLRVDSQSIYYYSRFWFDVDKPSS
jgi:hypothetical protein